MKGDTRAHVCGLLGEALQLLDREQAQLVAIHVSHAMELLRCPVSEDEASGPARV